MKMNLTSAKRKHSQLVMRFKAELLARVALCLHSFQLIEHRNTDNMVNISDKTRPSMNVPPCLTSDSYSSRCGSTLLFNEMSANLNQLFMDDHRNQCHPHVDAHRAFSIDKWTWSPIPPDSHMKSHPTSFSRGIVEKVDIPLNNISPWAHISPFSHTKAHQSSSHRSSPHPTPTGSPIPPSPLRGHRTPPPPTPHTHVEAQPMSGFSHRSWVSNSRSQLWYLWVPDCMAFLAGWYTRTRRVTSWRGGGGSGGGRQVT